MDMKLISISKAVASALVVSWLTIGLAGCNVSHGIAKDGSGAQQLVWPAPDDVTPIHHGGTFPDPAAVRAVQAGMNKHQIAMLIGYPHFEEGVWGVREWNYVFNFRDATTQQVTVCQYKILFDHDNLARSFYWKPDGCLPVEQQPVAKTDKPLPPETVLSTDALFAFDRWSLADITDGGRAQLDDLAGKLREQQSHIVQIKISGFTDRLGGDAYNQTLSQRRAETVGKYLVAHGVPAEIITAEGWGKAEPVVQCSEQERSALIACLAPNRRVVVRVETRGD
jgi:OmpA-OmpF porin, OOP family